MRASLELKQIPEAVQAAPGISGPADLLEPGRSVPIVLSLLIAVLVVLPVVWCTGGPGRRGAAPGRSPKR